MLLKCKSDQITSRLKTLQSSPLYLKSSPWPQPAPSGSCPPTSLCQAPFHTRVTPATVAPGFPLGVLELSSLRAFELGVSSAWITRGRMFPTAAAFPSCRAQMKSEGQGDASLATASKCPPPTSCLLTHLRHPSRSFSISLVILSSDFLLAL